MVATLVEIPIFDIRIDGGTQVRVLLDGRTVKAFADLMRDGVVFPPVVVFVDPAGAQYLADGFHRLAAAQQVGRTLIAADVHTGSREDALWFALGANRAHGRRLSPRDVRRAIHVALEQFPTRTQTELALHVGCSQGYVAKVKKDLIRRNAVVAAATVTGKGGRQYPASYPPRATVHPKREDVMQAVQAGASSKEIIATHHVRGELIADVRRELGIGKPITTPETTEARGERIRTMAGEGYTTHQIAAAIGVGDDRCRRLARDLGVTVSADAIVRGTRHHDSNRIVGRIVMDAEHLVAGSTLINFANLDRAQVDEWVRSLQQSRAALSAFIKRLQESVPHGQVA